jgi:hypothetical protein
MEQRQEQGLGPGDVTLETVRTWMLWQTEVERRIGARFAGTLDRCPGGVRRSIGQSAAPCQKQNGTLRGASWCVLGKCASAQYDASVSLEGLYSVYHLHCTTAVSGWRLTRNERR